MKKNKNIIFVLIAVTISIIILVLTILFVILDKKDFSDTENRNLAKFPKFTFERLRTGDFIEELEEYLADHFPFRNEFMSLKTGVLKTVGQDKIGELYLGKDGYLLEEYNVTPETTNIPIKTLNRFYSSLPEGTNMSLMLVPTSVEIYREKLPTFATNTSQRDVINYVYENIDFNGINVYDYLEKAKMSFETYCEIAKLKNEYASDIDNNIDTNLKEDFNLYYKTDHHWTTFGAYLGFVSYMDYLGAKELDRVEFQKITDDFYGTFYSKLIDNSLPKESMYKLNDDNIEYIVKNVATNKVTNTLYEDNWLDEKDKYSYFLGQNQALLEIENKSIQNDKKILIIKDSYGNSMIHFIAKEYKHVYVIDPRMYRISVSDYIKEKDISEVLLIYNAKTIETDLGIVSLR